MTQTLLLSAVWLNDADDPTDAMSFRSTGGIKVTGSSDVEVVAMAGGASTVVRRPGRTLTATPVLPECTAEQMSWLNTHEGRVVCFRDHQGTKFFGVYKQTPIDESTLYRDQGDAELEISGCDFSEVV